MKKPFALLILSILAAFSSYAQGLIIFGNNASSLTKISTNSVAGSPATGLTSVPTNGVGFYYALYYSATATNVNGQTSAIFGAGGNYVFNDTNWTLAAYGTNFSLPGRFLSAMTDTNGFTAVPGIPAGAAAQFVVIGWSANIGTSIAAVKSWFNNGIPASSGLVGESEVSGAIAVGNEGLGSLLFGGTPPLLQGFTLGLVGPLAQPPLQVPAIFNVSPTSGGIGTVVTISGTNFSASPAANIVYFGAVRGNVSTASPNRLTVTVPPGATYA